MSQAARAIIIENNQILVMYRQKYGSEYFTLVGGRLNDNESPEAAVKREVMEETGLQITSARLVFTEKHPAPYNEQFIFLCQAAPHGDIALQQYSEEALMNKLDANIHKPMWASLSSFKSLAFRTPQLHQAILEALKQGFPSEPKVL